jgi:ligand-binding sensor domain-containing protein
MTTASNKPGNIGGIQGCKPLISSLPIIALVLLAACTATPASMTLPATGGPIATNTPSPSVTPTALPTKTLIPTSTLLLPPTSTATATPEPDYLSAMVCDTEGNLWIGGFGGVLKFDPATEVATAYSLDKYSRNLQVSSLLITQEKTVWAVGWELFEVWELFRLDGKVWSKQEDIDDKCPIWLVAEGVEGTLWVGSDCGTYYYDGKTWHKYVRGEVPFMVAFARASDGTWWGTNTCCMMTAFFQFDGKIWTHSRPELVLDDFVSKIETAPDGSLWFKGDYHLYHYDTDLVWMPYTTTNASHSDWTRTLTVASNGAVWIGTDEGNVQRFQGEVWYDVEQYSNRTIRVMDSAPDGTVWAATSDDCIIQFDRNGATGKSYRVRQLDILPDSECLN